MESIIAAQQELHGRIARTIDNLKKAGSARINGALISTTLRLLDSKWARFEEQHEKLRLQHWDAVKTQEYYTQDYWGQTEEVYVLQRAALLEWDEKVKREKVKGEREVGDTSPAPPPRTTLPRIQLPTFSGKYEDWPPFRDLFKSLIVADTSISNVTRLHYLKTSLKGEAESLVSSLPTTEKNFKRAWQTLVNHYENTRILVRSFYSKYTALPKMKTESPSELRKLFHHMTSTVSALESIGRPITSSEDLFVFLTVEMLDPRSRREWENSIGASAEPPTHKELLAFLEQRSHTLEALHPSKGESVRAAQSHHVQAEPSKKQKERCTLCRKDHFLMMCDTFRGKSAGDRKRFVDDTQLCLNCLGKHKVSECKSKRNCTVCEGRHHSSLHEACRSRAVEAAPAVGNDVVSTLVAQRQSGSRCAVLLATARIQARDRFGEMHSTRALVDQGSETSIVTEAFAQRLRLSRTRASIAIFGVGGRQINVANGRLEFEISPTNGGRTFPVSAIVLPRLTIYAGVSSLAMAEWSHLRGLELADPDYMSADNVEVLLGADVYAEILETGIRRGGAREPIAQRTALGWIVSGVAGPVTSHATTMLHQCSFGEPLAALVKRFWEQEEITVPDASLTREERECEERFVSTHTREPDGRYCVRLPTILPLPDCSSTRGVALQTLARLERRFKQQPHLKQGYEQFLSEYEQLGHMTRAGPANEQGRVCYLPHHGVMKESSSTTKLRVVFNGSAAIPGAKGDSLNKRLLVGPNLLPPLADVLLRWRCHRYVVAADIEKMYRQIWVHPLDRDLQRIVWRVDTGEISDFRLNTVTYGLACAPYLAIRTLRQLADDESGKYPIGASVLRRDTYVDDVLTGADTREKVRQIIAQTRELCKAGGFLLKKWVSNQEMLLKDIAVDDLALPGVRAWLPHASHSTLGLQWHPTKDSFSFDIRMTASGPVTKRSVLSQSAQLFDPLGWFAPVVVRAKIFIQSTWLQGLDWDSPLPTSSCSTWRDFLDELPELAVIRVSRWLQWTSDSESAEIHGFADASERAYAAAIYLRVRRGGGDWTANLVLAKTKVAPLKQISLPRLELCAATLLTRLAIHVRRVLQLEALPTHLWSDSTVTLGWIRGHPSRWKTFVANRVAEIQTTLLEAQWHHVASQDNPADCASRGLTPRALADHPLWWRGPAWLQEGEAPWKATADTNTDEDLPEARTRQHVGVAQSTTEASDLLLRYSTLRRLLRITAWCRRWLRGVTRARSAEEALALSAAELEDALGSWVRLVQTNTYGKEIEVIQNGQELSRSNSLSRLTPFIDADGVLRVGGRIRHSLLAYEEKHPAILPRHSTLTALIVASCHSRTHHGGVQQTLGLLRQRYWVPGGRSAVKGHIQRCIQCTRWRAATPQQLMGDLPEPRVTPSRPFSHTGVDYAGPVMLRSSRGRGHKASKAFIAVFVCFSTRAVHLEVVSDYTAEAFLATMRRFVARRGSPQAMYSDRGTNFVGAEAELRAMFDDGFRDARRIEQALADESIQWRFNPPAAPHFGGLWEAAVKSLKHHLRRVLGDSTLTYEEMATFLAEVEACLNSRPLCPLSDDPEDVAALTPGHFLIGGPLLALPERSLLDVPVNRLSRWQHVQQMREHFWRRWSQEYLHSLAHRPKWWTSAPAPQVGQLCLVRSETTSPAKWPLARITAIHPGDDGRVRVVTVTTATATLKRPLTKIILLPRESRDHVRGADSK
ncbi:PREDICTED: uncharacterized protein LOC105556088 [Vollenhovia emeryi]|uniref:uncharacterized protein LOC105556088 n=1 Tax=Vollenhovia emeryi TaxID=411798 RepID=UPI0005F522A7|nr:PREDICTED: uncharacterized protein LOC105556088 [Vollenhovia emeryi]